MIFESKLIFEFIFKIFTEREFIIPHMLDKLNLRNALDSLISEVNTEPDELDWVRIQLIKGSEFCISLKPMSKTIYDDEFWIQLNKLSNRWLNISIVPEYPNEIHSDRIIIKFVDKFKFMANMEQISQLG